MSIYSNCFAPRRDAFPTCTLAALLFPESSSFFHLGSFLRRREPLFRRTGKKQVGHGARDMPGCILATWASLDS
ncbi:hypothetical protein E4U09_005065 [Claviceps aff. purpurea]|uniref:Uncharacterized protein n=1 Tax=Claviceps aff. purpurea TaxID=1967640 RepID=A0A9P7QEA5_9HYPO|nr:hypothetical protein E4U37_006175 [Claviceps purpurea]KAG6214423.1 hypothetical protein E4U50_000361 [Claviceps purpurea]KAG6289328.1 hypothetical protein E4U09_005065 [Claviceps aff. purpurea]